jgi:hypothetical protein
VRLRERCDDWLAKRRPAGASARLESLGLFLIEFRINFPVAAFDPRDRSRGERIGLHVIISPLGPGRYVFPDEDR